MVQQSHNLLLEASRVAMGLTQAALATRSGVAQSVISKFENGSLPLDHRIERIAQVLGVPAELVDGTVRHFPNVRVFHRKQASLPAKIANKLRADMLLAHVRVEALIGEAHIASGEIPTSSSGLSFATPSMHARQLREIWGIPEGPIANMVGLLESAGVPCLMWDIESAKADAIASWPDGIRPLVMLNRSAPGDRLRFTVAHELGHAVMHSMPTPHGEREADEFAAEFLMPRSQIRDSLRGATLYDLMDLKKVWGTSIAALARRARDIGSITESAYRSLNIELSTSGFRKNEPIPVPVERPSLIRDVVLSRCAAGESPSEVARAAFMTEAEMLEYYLEEK